MEFETVVKLFFLIGIGFPFSFILFMIGWHIFEMTNLGAILMERLSKKLDE